MKILRWSLLMTLSVMLTVSCTEEESEVSPLTSELSQRPEPILKDQELEETANLLANFIDENQVTAELFTYATEENDGEVYAPFEDLFAPKKTSTSGIKGSFASKFRSFNELNNGRKKNTIQLKDLEKKLGDGYALYAPYLVERFSDSKQPITISWYNGQDTSGVTPGISSVKNGRTLNGEYVQVTDEYALNNPTVVIVPAEDVSTDLLLTGSSGIGSGGSTGGGGSSSPSNLSCTLQRVKMEMPQYKLRDHVRPWPNSNKLYLWVATGDYTIDSDGSVQTGYDAPLRWRKKKVSRHNVGKWLSSDLSFIVNDWKAGMVDMHLVFGYHKLFDGDGLTYTGTVGVIPDTSVKAAVEYTIKQNQAKLLTTPIFDRCATLSRQATAGSYGLKNGFRVYRFDKIEFYLKGTPTPPL
jgi:hypothetical protein